MERHPNFLLARLSQGVLDDTLSDAKQLQIQPGQMLAEARGVLSQVYFPHSGALASLVDLSGGKEIETSLIGRDGVFGAGNALDDSVTLNRVTALVGGISTVLSTARVNSLAERYEEFRKLVLAYEQFNYAQAQQTAACNASHSVEARCCRWLLRMQDLNGTDLNFTQELISRMLGVRRTSVTDVAGALAAEQAIRYSRGRLKILDVAKLASRACECYGTIRLSYERLFPRDRAS